jgi:small subunit ribosomal protein S18
MSMNENNSRGGERGSREGSDRPRTGGASGAGMGGMGGGMGGGFRRRKTCPFSGDNAPKIDYKDVRLLGRYVTERGKMIPSRISAVSNKKQRELAQAIKRARFLALMPYTAQVGGANERD